MPEGLSSLIIALVLTLLLAVQAAQAAPRSRLRQAFALGASAMVVAAGLNLLVLLGLSGSWAVTILPTLAMALFLGCVIALSLAFFNGELRAKLRQAQHSAAAERARRAGRPPAAAPPAPEEHDEPRA